MTTTTYEGSLTVGQGRKRYFDAWGFGDGGYSEKWVKLQMGPIPFAFPNTSQRIRSVHLHDLHHVLTEYRADWQGEAEIGAWELATGCRDHYAAWVLNTYALGYGAALFPVATLRAFARGRRTRNLYAGEWDEALLGESVGAARARLGLDAPAAPLTPTDVALFAVSALGAWAFALTPLTVVLWLVATLVG